MPEDDRADLLGGRRGVPTPGRSGARPGGREIAAMGTSRNVSALPVLALSLREVALETSEGVSILTRKLRICTLSSVMCPRPGIGPQFPPPALVRDIAFAR